MKDIFVQNYVKLWPREVFYITDSQCVGELRKSLDCPGVYILYLDFDAQGNVIVCGTTFQRSWYHERTT
jgi:hypothetical protein